MANDCKFVIENGVFMKIRCILSSLFLLFLVACATSTAEKEVASSTGASLASSSVNSQAMAETGSSSSQSTAPASISTQPTDNGSYYSVEGKYGEVIIVNKRYPLSSDYAPGEIPEAVSAFQDLVTQMQSLGYDVSRTQYSGFRSYDMQAGLYQSYVANDGKERADRYSARAGYSEHQTGLAYDILDNSGALLTEPSATTWLAENAHSYGFIVRYPPGKEAITGYMPESWHIRYIGREASDIYQSGKTLEEYFGVSGGGYED